MSRYIGLTRLSHADWLGFEPELQLVVLVQVEEYRSLKLARIAMYKAPI